MRTLVSFDIFDFPELDFVRNPVPAPGKYHNADRGEPVGPGHASLFGVVFAEGAQMHSLALVWSQAFSFPNRTNAHADDATIRKRAQQIKLHYNHVQNRSIPFLSPSLTTGSCETGHGGVLGEGEDVVPTGRLSVGQGRSGYHITR